MQNGSFIDYYDLLMISPAADVEMLEAAVRVGLARYNPKNEKTGDKHKFELVKQAYLTLSNPQARAVYDREHKLHSQIPPREVSEDITPEDIEIEKEKRQRVLVVLYARLRGRSHDPGVTVPQIGESLGFTPDDLHFSLWFLREKKWITRMENGSFRISAEGVEWVEDYVLRLPAKAPPKLRSASDREETPPRPKGAKQARNPEPVAAAAGDRAR